jgi:integrase
VEPLTSGSLLAAWSAEATPAASTLRSYQGKFRQLTRILGFDDLRRVTPDDVVKFKEARLKEGRNPGTVADDVLSMGAVCNWAKGNHKLASNPFAGLAPKGNRRGPASRHPYDDDEAERLLLAARKEDGWLRWLPWLLCFTGARISELGPVDIHRRATAEAARWIIALKL